MSERRQFSSWKEIAAHFGRDVRTVQRWEKDEGLPIHRHAHRARHSIYAYADELDAWWHVRPEAPAPVAEETVADTPPAPVPLPRPAADPITAIPRPPPVPLPARPPRASRRLLAIGAALVLSIVLLVPVASLRPRARTTLPMATWEVDAPYGMIAAGDVDGDGRPEVALSATAAGFWPRVYRVNAGTGTLGVPLVEIHMDGPVHVYVDSAPDLNGDGFDDLLVTTMNSDVAIGTSPAFILFGRKTWPARIHLPRDADVRLELTVAHDARLGGCLSTDAFDLNRDGLRDLVFAAPEFSTGERSGAGAVFVVHGRAAWPAVVSLLEEADVHILGSRKGEGLGLGCASGDWDGDGWPELAAHAGEHTLWAMRGSAGRTYLVHGGPEWPRQVDLANTFFLRVDNAVPRSGMPRIALADVNADGRADLLRTSPLDAGDRSDTLRIWFGGGARGVRTGSDEEARVRIGHEDSLGARLLATRDFDGDGRADVLLADTLEGVSWLIGGRTEWPREMTIARAGARVFGTGGTAYSPSLSLMDADEDGLLDFLLARRLPDGAREAFVDVIPLYERISIDVRPGFERNVVIVPAPVVVRISGASLPVDLLDAATLRLNGAAPTEWRADDEDGDGKPDLQLYFNSGEMAFDARPIARLVGHRRDGRLVGATQEVEIVRRTGRYP